MKRTSLLFSLFRIPLDALSFFIGAYGAYVLRPEISYIPFEDFQLVSYDSYFSFMIWGAVAFVLLQFFQKSYTFTAGKKFFIEVSETAITLMYLFFGILGFYAFFFTTHFFSRGVLLLTIVLTFILALFFRFLLRVTQRYLQKNGQGVSRIFIIGDDERRADFIQNLTCEYEYRVVGESSVLDEDMIKKSNCEELWYMQDETNKDERKIIEYTQIQQKKYRFIPDVSGILHASIDENEVGGYPVLSIVPTTITGWGAVVKRMLDIIFSSVLLVCLLPLFIVVAILIKIDMPGPVFYTSYRVGKNGNLFPLYKFRSMVVNADQLKAALAEQNERGNSPLFKMKNDPRITRFGNFLRRFSIDELPQFFNVLLGTMSVVGPRPHLPKEVEMYKEEQKRVLTIKPGITGLPQVSGRSDLPFDEEVRLDLFYMVHWSLLWDLHIILKTPFVLLGGKGAD